MKAVLNFTPAGNVEGLYTEVIPLAELGALHIERWTVIEFNNDTERWEVKRVTETGAVDPTVLFSHASRETCLRWEHGMFAESEAEPNGITNHTSPQIGAVMSSVANTTNEETI